VDLGLLVEVLEKLFLLPTFSQQIQLGYFLTESSLDYSKSVKPCLLFVEALEHLKTFL
jgi:hypothetical protein